MAGMAETKSLFRATEASDALLRAVANRAPPERKTFNWDVAKTGDGLFRLKAASLPTLEKTSKKKSSIASWTSGAPEHKDPTATATAGAIVSSFATSASAFATASSLADSGAATKPMSRANRYFEALMKAERKREQATQKEEWETTKKRMDKAAQRAYKEAKLSERDESVSESGSEDEEDVDDGRGPLPLMPYYDKMKIELEVVVLRAADAKKGDTPAEFADVDGPSTATPSSSSSEKSTPRVDLNAELEGLNEEMAEFIEEPESSEDDMPDWLKNRKTEPKSIRNHDNDRAALALAGTCFYVPDVERLALAPSLPPPPPPSLHGARRWRLKPRLPLDISRNRYRDEYPSIDLLREPFMPTAEQAVSLERTMKVMDFYASADRTLTRMNQKIATSLKKPKKGTDLDKAFGTMVDKDLRGSVAWKTYIKRKELQEVRLQRAALAESASAPQLTQTR